MSPSAEACPQCSAPTGDSGRFCGNCGYDLVQRPPVGGGGAPAGPGKPAGANRTMMGMPQFGAAAPESPPQASQPSPSATPKRTMMGMPAFSPPAAGSSAGAPSKGAAAGGFAPVPVPHSDPAPTGGGASQGPSPDAFAATEAMPQVDPSDVGGAPPPAGGAPVAKKPKMGTMIGLAAAPPSAAAGSLPSGAPAPVPRSPGSSASAPSPAAPSPATPAPKPNATMLGMPATAPPAGAAPQGVSPHPAPPAAAHHQPVAQPTAPAPNTNRTMLGMSATPGAGAQGGKPAPQSNRTMIGVAQQAPPAGAPATVQTFSPSSVPPSRPRRRWPLFVALALVGFGLAGAAVWLLLQRGPDVRARVKNEGGGEILEVDLPGVPAGTKVRFDGVERAIEAGRVRFPLEADDLQLGDNEFVLDVIEDGAPRQATVILSVPYRVRVDLAALQSDEPALRVVVDALPGSQAMLDGDPVALDENGRGSRSYPLEASGDEAVYERSVRFRIVDPEGQVAEGEVPARIPYASLQVDRPASSSVTDQESVAIVGGVLPEATVLVDGETVSLHESGRFTARVELPMGESEHRVVARQPGRAPRVRVLRVRRVADLAEEAARYEVDDSLGYGRIAANPDAYRGKQVAFTGRVYNVNLHEGRSALQVVVNDCPRGQRCPLWVSYDGAAEAELNSWVRVLGELSGAQQFRARSGEVRSVPRLDAVFVLPAESTGSR